MTNSITTLSRERLNKLIEQYDDEGYCDVKDDEVIAALRALLAVMDAKPYGYVAESPCSSGYGGMMHAFSIERLDAEHDADEHDGFVFELYTTPPAPSAPDGWIKCSDRMPDGEGKYTTMGSYGVSTSWFHNPWGQKFIFQDCDTNNDEGNEGFTVTHWMPLPAAPGGE